MEGSFLLSAFSGIMLAHGVHAASSDLNSTKSYLARLGGQSSTLESTHTVTIWSILLGVLILYYLWSAMLLHYASLGIPLVGTRSIYEPQFLVSWRFFRDAAKVLNDGYSRFPDRVWKFTRADVDMLVLPPRYVPELRSLPSTIADPTAAHVFNLAGQFTDMEIVLQNHLHFRTLQEKLTPNLSKLTKPMLDELDNAIRLELPGCDDDWVPTKPYYSILRLVARISARVFLGLPLCRSEEWLEISTQYTENAFMSLLIIRMLPRFLHRCIAWCLPSVWRTKNYIRRAKKLLTPEIDRRKASFESGNRMTESNTLLSWMIELADNETTTSQDLAHLEVVISLASIHTSHTNAVHILYDLAAHPQYVQILRDEMQTVIAQDGPWEQWSKNSFSKLRKLDSFMRESQRYNPPTLLSFHRIMASDYTTSDGFLIPKGAHITMPVNAIQNDPDVTADPLTFDPMRYYRLRESEGQSHLHQFATTEPRILNFGHGKYACPGRFFASLEIKCILVRLLLDYDWKLPDECHGKRPANLSAQEYVFPNQEGVLMMRKRQLP